MMRGAYNKVTKDFSTDVPIIPEGLSVDSGTNSHESEK